MTWTRMERAGLDMLIAELARYGVEANICIPLPPGVYEAIQGTPLGDSPRRMAARLALYLRLLRRVEAWESRPFSDWPDWTCPRYQAPRDDGTWVTCDRVQHETWFNECGGYEECRLAHWRPLWLDAPPYDPAVTPRMRREAIEARRDLVRSGVNKAAKATFWPMAKAFPGWKP